MAKAMIGLEIHVQLTEAGSKLFCDCRSDYRGMKPNENVCPVCLGLPGALPVASRRAIILAIAIARALQCSIPEAIVFTRKHYFYPDLPKNYQITQYEKVGGAPVCEGGFLTYIDTEKWEWRSVRIRRINLEEDPGRTIYPEGDITRSEKALVDYNRSGVPLLEIVTEPDIEGPREARSAIEYLLLILEYIGATNPRLEGAFRVDANVSVEGGERVEVKNIGSVVDVEKALRYELLRQESIVREGGRIGRETRHWDSVRGVTKPLRYKETEEEYLYFPDPDLPPIRLTRDMIAEATKLASLLPSTAFDEITRLGIPRDIAWSIVSVRHASRLFLESVKLGASPQILARIIGIDYKGELREAGLDPYNPSNWPPASTLKAISQLIEKGEYTYDTIKGLVIPVLARKPHASLSEILPEKAANVGQVVDQVLREERKAVEDYLSGNKKALNYLIGSVIKRIGKKA
ncbi:MAG: Asp-tRNA(Asn)/Glu-tRNA(Gln) amidotransferase subunit GatB, partial [Desulfurococcales archaeon]|nr:Asp-tRNA(Asn)/Glu-tRNA(Gln) amidotransferase subunit GatB [Desulfurococcales archaeon]